MLGPSLMQDRDKGGKVMGRQGVVPAVELHLGLGVRGWGLGLRGWGVGVRLAMRLT